jgi:osmoprotectant transport system permease protein
LNLLAGRINDAVMTELNYRVDFLKQAPEEVARDFLVQQKLWRPARQGKQGTIRLGSKIFAEQYLLVHMYRMLITGYTDLQVETKTGLGGTKICFDALVSSQIDMYPEYTGTGLLVLLQPSRGQLRSLMGSKERVYAYVKDQFEKQYQLTWLQPIGFNNAYALMMRRRQARDLDLHSISDLKDYLNRPKP